MCSKDGRVYTLGDGSKGQLGNGEDMQRCKRAELVGFFKKKTVIQVSAGECQTAFLTGTFFVIQNFHNLDGIETHSRRFSIIDKNELFSCGDNRHGKLGLDQKKFNSIQFYPHLVDKFKQLKVTNVRYAFLLFL